MSIVGACAPQSATDPGFEPIGQSVEALFSDSGIVFDSGVVTDSGATTDSGVVTDSGGATDSGVVTDSGGATDSGVVTDSGGADAAPKKCEDTADISNGDCCGDSDCRRVPGMEICLNFTCQGRKGETPGSCNADPNFSPGEEGALNTCDPGGTNTGMPYSVSCAGPKLPPTDCYVPLGTACRVCTQAGETNHVDTSAGCTVVPGGMCVDFSIIDATGINVIAGPCP